MARFSTLDQWLNWQQTLHSLEIDLGLDRVISVLDKLNCRADFPIIAVAGTNGKGSTVAALAAIYQNEGYAVGHFMSPHILHYNERICVFGQPVADEEICQAFEMIDQARGDITLTYFEFSTLAAFWVFCRNRVEVAIMEVGLGGRLDAVNAFDLSLSVVTTIDIDHTEWLGNTREAIALEKSGIFRASHPAVCGDPKPPKTLLNHAEKLGTDLYIQGTDFGFFKSGGFEIRKGGDDQPVNFSFPTPLAPHQMQNMATALMATQCLCHRLPVSLKAGTEKAVLQASLPGRSQCIATSPSVILDVAHNAESVQALAHALKKEKHNKTVAVFSLLNDKFHEHLLSSIADQIDHWHIAPLNTPRAMPIGKMKSLVTSFADLDSLSMHESIWRAYRSAKKNAEKRDRIVVFGSFYTVAAIMTGLQCE